GRELVLDMNEALRVFKVVLDGRSASWTLEEGRLRVPLSGANEEGSRFRAEIFYGGPLAEVVSQGEPVGLLSDRTVLVAYDEPDGARNWFPCNDHPSDKATYDFFLTVPAGNLAVATGSLRGLTFLGGLLTFHWGSAHRATTYGVGLAAGPFEPILRPAKVPVLDLALPGDRRRVEKNLASITEMIPFLARRFGPYPFERYGHVFTRRPVGGLENQTMTVLGRGGGIGGNPRVLVHELAHQWFGDWVSPLSWSDLWLNEGWASYCEWLWMEHKRGPGGGRPLLKAWRQSSLRLARSGSSWTLSRPNPENLFSGTLVYHKGGMVLHLLEEYLGTETFRTATRAYLQRHGEDNASSEDLEADFQESSGQDLHPFFQTWVRGNAVPEVRLRLHAAQSQGGWLARVELEQALGIPLPPRWNSWTRPSAGAGSCPSGSPEEPRKSKPNSPSARFGPSWIPTKNCP
ncbi:MAG: M1 family metallopeptidase, partial [Planctomycetota bacterium]